MKKWSDNDKKYAIYLIENEYSYKQISEKLNRTVKSVQRKLEGYHSSYRNTLYVEITCKCCNTKFKVLKTEKRIFCSRKCQLQNIIDDKKIDYNKLKIDNCIECGCEVKIKNNTNYSITKCKKCNVKKCKYCGESINNNRSSCSDCFPHIQKVNFFKKINIFKYNVKLNILNDEAIEILSDMYYIKKYSRLQISQILNVDKKSIYIFFIKNNFKLRNLSECISNAIYQGRIEINKKPNQYKCGWHKTWNCKNVYYRSSYELDYCDFLDENKIDYVMESLKIKYFDSILKKERIAIPDFYLLNTNEIVEIKSDWTYDEQNMKDKIISYKKLGYNIKIILEHKEYIIS